MTPLEHFQQGKLNDAVAEAIAQVRSKPNDIDSRGVLSELYCFRGDFEKADSQLEALLALKPDLLIGINVFRQLIRAETARIDFYRSGRLPEFLDTPSEEFQHRLRASIFLREDDPAHAQEELDKAEGLTQTLHVKYGEQSQLDFRDLDDLTSDLFEVFTVTGKYLWIPMHSVENIRFLSRSSIIDFCWAPVTITLCDHERELQGYLPMLYPVSFASEDPNIQTGRATDWLGGDGSPMRGIGQRMFLIGDEAVPVTSITILEFE